MNIFITGGAHGIGRAAAEHLMDDHTVTVYDSDRDALAALPDTIEAVEGDVRDMDAVTAAVDAAEPDVVITCAGFQARGAIEDMGMETVREHIETNLYGTLHAVKAALPHLRPDGRIVTVSSLAGRVVGPYWGAYSASKYGVEAVSDALRLELRDTDVDVAIVEPGPVRTGFNETGRDFLERYLPGSRHADRYRAILSRDLGGVSPEKAGRVVARAATASRPKTRYTVTWIAWLAPELKAVLPTRVMDVLADRSG